MINKAEKIKNIFTDIASKYDFVNNIISLGTHQFVKLSAIKLLKIQSGQKVLDLCCGTGDITKIINKTCKDVDIIGLDFSESMLEIAKQKNPNTEFVVGDCTNLDFNNAMFDFVIISFGLRNVCDRQKCIEEIYRILKNGGKCLHLDFAEHNFFSKIFDMIVILVQRVFKLNENHYKHLINSKALYPNPKEIVIEFSEKGFTNAAKKDYIFNVISAQVFVKKR